MKFSKPNPTTSQADLRNTFDFSPAAFSIASPQPANIADFIADGYNFDIGNLTDNLKVHDDSFNQSLFAIFKHGTEMYRRKWMTGFWDWEGVAQLS